MSEGFGKLVRSEEATPKAKQRRATSVETHSTRQAAIDVVNSPNDAIRETLERAQSIASDRLQSKKEDAANKIADQIVATSEAELNTATDFLLKALGGGWLKGSMETAAIEAGWIDAEVIEG